MLALLTLLIITLSIVFLQRRIWKKLPNISFVVVTVVLYYWSLAGSWLICFDKITGWGHYIGLKYWYLEERMFKINLDFEYSLSILLLGLFIVFFQLIVLIAIKKGWLLESEPREIGETVHLTTVPFIIISVFSVLLSLWIVKDVIAFSLILKESVYINIRSSGVPLYTLHQYLNLVIAFASFLPLGLYYRKNQQYVTIQKPKVLFWIVFIISNLYLIMIGSRHEVFFSGIFMLILISYPKRSIRKSYKTYLLFFGLLGFILILNDPIRALMPTLSHKSGLTSLITSKTRKLNAELYMYDRTFVVHKSENIVREKIRDYQKRDTLLHINGDTIQMKIFDFYQQQLKNRNFLTIENHDTINKITNKYISEAYSKGKVRAVIDAMTNVIFSNELFAGHFSMYGVIKYRVQPKLGMGFKSLGSAFIPGFIRKDDMENSYTYYAESLNLPKDQGFTINHITSWFLSFSYFGIMLGAFFLASIVILTQYLLNRCKNQTLKMLYLIIFIGVSASSVFIVRSGISVYKIVLYECIFIPVFIFSCSLLYESIMQKLRGYRKK